MVMLEASALAPSWRGIQPPTAMTHGGFYVDDGVGGATKGTRDAVLRAVAALAEAGADVSEARLAFHW